MLGRGVGLRAAAAAALALAVACAHAPREAPAARAPSVPAPPPPRAPAPDATAATPEAEAPVAVDPVRASLVAVLRAETPDLADDAREEMADAILRLESRTGMPPLLVVALIRQESLFDVDAVGPRGAVGLMQLRPFVAAKVAPRNGIAYEGPVTLRDPVANVSIGCAYLAELHARFGSARLALAAYNKGPTRVSRELRRGADPGGRFVGRVLHHYEGYESRFGLADRDTPLPVSEAAQ